MRDHIIRLFGINPCHGFIFLPRFGLLGIYSFAEPVCHGLAWIFKSESMYAIMTCCFSFHYSFESCFQLFQFCTKSFSNPSYSLSCYCFIRSFCYVLSIPIFDSKIVFFLLLLVVELSFCFLRQLIENHFLSIFWNVFICLYFLSLSWIFWASLISLKYFDSFLWVLPSDLSTIVFFISFHFNGILCV